MCNIRFRFLCFACMNWLFIAVSFFVVFLFCCRGLFVSFKGKIHQEGSYPSYAAGRRLGGFPHHHQMLLENLWSFVQCTPQCAWLLKRLVFAEARDLTSWHKTTNCYRATIVCLDVKGLWKPGQSFILAGFTLSLPCSAPCGTEQTTTAGA